MQVLKPDQVTELKAAAAARVATRVAAGEGAGALTGAVQGATPVQSRVLVQPDDRLGQSAQASQPSNQGSVQASVNATDSGSASKPGEPVLVVGSEREVPRTILGRGRRRGLIAAATPLAESSTAEALNGPPVLKAKIKTGVLSNPPPPPPLPSLQPRAEQLPTEIARPSLPGPALAQRQAQAEGSNSSPVLSARVAESPAGMSQSSLADANERLRQMSLRLDPGQASPGAPSRAGRLGLESPVGSTPPIVPSSLGTAVKPPAAALPVVDRAAQRKKWWDEAGALAAAQQGGQLPAQPQVQAPQESSGLRQPGAVGLLPLVSPPRVPVAANNTSPAVSPGFAGVSALPAFPPRYGFKSVDLRPPPNAPGASGSPEQSVPAPVSPASALGESSAYSLRYGNGGRSRPGSPAGGRSVASSASSKSPQNLRVITDRELLKASPKNPEERDAIVQELNDRAANTSFGAEAKLLRERAAAIAGAANYGSGSKSENLGAVGPAWPRVALPLPSGGGAPAPLRPSSQQAPLGDQSPQLGIFSKSNARVPLLQKSVTPPPPPPSAQGVAPAGGRVGDGNGL